jgi:hypothetical protein
VIAPILLTILVAGGGERENRKGVEALRSGNAKSAASHFDAAVKADTTNARFRYNRALSRSMAGAPADADWDAARRDTSLLSKALYNRGTARLKAAQSGQGDAKGAVSDLAQALKKRPGWNEAAKNLELAMRLQKQQEEQKKKDDKKQDKDKKDQPKKDPQKKPGDPKDNGDKNEKPEPQPGQPDPKEALSKDQADQMLRAAEARDQDRRQKNAQKAKETNGKDW